MSDAYTALRAHLRAAHLLGSTSALLAWDQETYMPKGAGDVRAEQLALLAELQHERATDPRVADWLAACEADARLQHDADALANVRGWAPRPRARHQTAEQAGAGTRRGREQGAAGVGRSAGAFRVPQVPTVARSHDRPCSSRRPTA